MDIGKEIGTEIVVPLPLTIPNVEPAKVDPAPAAPVTPAPEKVPAE